MASHTNHQNMIGRIRGALMSLSSACYTGSARYRKRVRLVYAIAIVVGMGGFVGHLYSSAIASFGMVAIIILGSAVLQSIDEG